ncbi:FAD:protein FMN transferase, partial [Eubacteriales bacterium OttesenSCG-928-M02]|nr:FAD:protein FMN transferase [Eubacteriales bacterium OttesenSCG-928-M02]
CTLSVMDTNVITSGVYERYVVVDGKRYHHVFNPKTGMPSDSGVLSATVIGKDGALCDALATALVVLGEEEGLALVAEEGFPVDVILVTADDRVVATPGIREKLTLTAERYTLQ